MIRRRRRRRAGRGRRQPRGGLRQQRRRRRGGRRAGGRRLRGRLGSGASASPGAAGVGSTSGDQTPIRAQEMHRHATATAEALSGERLRPELAGEPEAPLVGVYEPLRPGSPPPLRFSRVASLGADGDRTTDWRTDMASCTAGHGARQGQDIVRSLEGAQPTHCAVRQVQVEGGLDGGESATTFAKFFKSLPLESLLDVRGVLVESNVTSCTQSTVELQMDRPCLRGVRVPGDAAVPAGGRPARREGEIEASQETDRPYVRVLPDLRLDNRWLDLRVPANNGIMRVQAAVCRIFRNTLTAKSFIEIHSPKLISGESEGGADVFRTDYFGRQASLAQSPQLYKQMAMSADLPGVFEVGPVFRAENSNTNRHLCEFTGLDLEMPIDWHYDEVAGACSLW
ncbi:unnamed protein product [Prorocentrum cordatum]|uniref:aspartate--tRNA ligase n=1 Tax=Prorocentrum cordatum TaxID=2364126 RepID=A0ABN9U7X1_9DINO|nr:unnamed protein product [Polarella glacialis]